MESSSSEHRRTTVNYTSAGYDARCGRTSVRLVYASTIVVDVVTEGPERPPEGAPIVVQVLDTTYADAPARVVHEASSRVAPGEAALLHSVELPVAAPTPGRWTVRAHVDVDGDGAVSPGDFVTTAAYPLLGEERLRVVVRKV
jgi:hypothetical protein